MKSNEPQFVYRPSLEDAADFLRPAGVSRLLLVGRPLKSGEGLPTGFEDATECRHIADPEVSLPKGSYRFRGDDIHSVMLVADGAEPEFPDSGGCTPDGARTGAGVGVATLRHERHDRHDPLACRTGAASPTGST